MSDDILSRIDEAMARNATRFDPLDGQHYCALDGTEGMRWRPPDAEPLLAPVVPPRAASPYLTREDITGRPAGAAEAFRTEARRPGLTEYEENGVRWVYVEGEWMTAPVSGGPPGSWFDETHVFRRAYLNERVEALRPFFAPAVDAEMARLQAQVDRLETLSLECGMGNPLCSGCDGLNRNNGRCAHECHGQASTAGPPDISRTDQAWQPLLDRLAGKRPWWKRWFR